jgi:hypothetical protein
MFGLGFLAPVFLLGALAVAVPIVLHLIRKRTELIVDFSAVRLLTRAPAHVHRHRRLRELILLALRVAALVLLGVSFARPFIARAVAPASAPLTVVAVDTSFSLSAPGQMDRARAAARDAVESAPSSDAVALVAFADAATVVATPTSDRRAVEAAIDRLEAGPGGTRYRTALAKVTEVIGARRARVVIVTDLQQAGWDASDEGGLPDEVDCDVVAVPAPPGNLAVTSAERLDTGVRATVQNYTSQSARVPVRLMVETRAAAETTVDVGPFAAVDVRLGAELAATGAARVEVADEAGYQDDNVRHLVLDRSPALPITVIVADPTTKASGIYMERALAVAGEGREFAPDIVDGRTLSTWGAAEVSRRAAFVVIGTRTLDRRGRELVRQYLAGGGQVLLTLGPDVEPLTLADVVGVDLGIVPQAVKPDAAPALIASDSRHPIFRPFLTQSGALGDVLIEQYRRLKDQSGRMVLARLTGGDIALTEQEVGTGRLLVFASDLDNRWSRFPLNPSFVPFAVETARYLTEGRRRPQAWMLPDVPPGVSSVPGVHGIGGTSGERVAVNVDTRESNPAATGADEFTGGIDRVGRAAAPEPLADIRAEENRQRLWQIGLGLMFVALAAEALVGRRAV